MTAWWNKQIERADELAAESSGSSELLSFYSQLLRAQREIYVSLRSLPTGDLHTDLPKILETMPILLIAVEANGPEVLAAEAGEYLKSSDEVLSKMLIDHWQAPSHLDFFSKAFLQPYLRLMADSGVTPTGRMTPKGERWCPFCGGNAQVSFLQSKEANGESGNRDLVCAGCLSSWETRRVVCVHCGEERPTQLGYFHTPEFDHVRIEACETCKHYIKGVDLTRLGFAAPLVDEVAAAPLDLWAQAHGYQKIELNLVGL